MAKPAVTLVIGAGLLWLLVSRLGHLDPVAIRDAVHDVALHQWALALVAVAVSFLAVGGQERVLHRHLRTGVTGPQAFCAGIAAGATVWGYCPDGHGRAFEGLRVQRVFAHMDQLPGLLMP